MGDLIGYIIIFEPKPLTYPIWKEAWTSSTRKDPILSKPFYISC